MIFTSREAGSICMTQEIQKALADLRSFMFARVYHNPVAKGEESKARDMLQMLFRFMWTIRSSSRWISSPSCPSTAWAARSATISQA